MARAYLIISLAILATFVALNPKYLNSSSAGAEAPNELIPSTLSANLYHSSALAASTAKILVLGENIRLI